MGNRKPEGGWLYVGALYVVVMGFMTLSLAFAATGTSRFAVAMGYPAIVGCVVGVIFDLGKSVLPVAAIALLARKKYALSAVVGTACLGLACYSVLATEATVSSTIAAIGRTAAAKIEARSGMQAELAAIEKRLEVISVPAPPRPTKTLIAALAAEKVPRGVWVRSQECNRIRDRYFQAACAKVLNLRRELAAAEDYEKLAEEARRLRNDLAAAQIVAASDPLPQAFADTIGRFVPVGGCTGVALLFTLIVEIVSTSGPATLRSLGDEGTNSSRGPETELQSTLNQGRRATAFDHAKLPDMSPRHLRSRYQDAGESPSIRAGRDKKVPALSGSPVTSRRGTPEHTVEAEKNVPPLGKGHSVFGSHVPEFARDCLRPDAKKSVASADIWQGYLNWCSALGYAPLSRRKFGIELKALRFEKWKTSGLIRYRHLQLVE